MTDLIETAKRLVELSEKATPGPCTVERWLDPQWYVQASGVAVCLSAHGNDEANMRFIAAAYDHSPALARDYLALREQLAAREALVVTLAGAAEALRAAQRAYMADRGNHELGKVVADRAAQLDAALSAPEVNALVAAHRGTTNG